jgi:hypothetical protein
MLTFTGFEYLLIDVANHFGLDKLTFEARIDWARNHLDQLESMTSQADKSLLYMKAVAAVRKAQLKLPTGHLVALDACCSGLQIMSALTGCVSGARATGLIDPDRRADAYTEQTQRMQVILGDHFNVSRDDAKNGLMTSLYGSKEQPKIIFGEDTPELAAFYQSLQEMAPGAYELLQELLDTWQPHALVHAWKLPDGYDARVKVMKKEECRIEVDELDHASFTYEYYVNQGSKKGLANVANVIHSIDAFILRELIRRCNWQGLNIPVINNWLAAALMDRGLQVPGVDYDLLEGEHLYFIEQYQRSGQPSAAILPWLNASNVHDLPTDLLHALKRITNTMLEYKPFPVVTIHDSFAAHANNCNWVRHWYKELLAELADSEILSDIMSQLHQSLGSYGKLTPDLSKHIRESNYALS